MALLMANNAVGTLASGINTSVTSIALGAGQGAKFPSPTGSDYFMLTVVKADGSREIMKCTARSTDTLTVVRAQEGTLALSFLTGDRAENRMTAGSFSQLPAANLTTPRNFSITGKATASAQAFDGQANVVLTVTSLDATGLTNLVPAASLPDATESVKGASIRASNADVDAAPGVQNDTDYLTVAKGVRLINVLGTMPAGVVLPFAGSSLPTGFQWPNGQAVSRVTFAALFTALGTTYGAGDGSNTFNLPDLRGRAPFGKDDLGGASAASRLTSAGSGVNGAALGASGGAQNVTLDISTMPLHGHPYRHSVEDDAISDLDGGMMTDGNAANRAAFTGTPSNTIGQQIGGTGGGAAHNNMPPALVTNYIIKS